MFRKRPRSTLTRSQIKKAERMIGKFPVTQIAAKLGTSTSNVKRAFRGKSLWFKNGKYKNNPSLVRSVLQHYERHGKRSTEKAFPSVNVKCIVDRPLYYGYQIKPRQIRWKSHELKKVVQMAAAGIPYETQAKILDRPGAHAGSIKSVWVKRLSGAAYSIHGLPHNTAKHFLSKQAPFHKMAHFKMAYWCEMEPYLLPGTPKFIRDAVRIMTKFQKWIFESERPIKKIMAMAKHLKNHRNAKEKK